MKNFGRVFFLSALAALASGSARAAGVPGIKLSGSRAVYSFSEGRVFRNGSQLTGPAAAGEAERVRRVALFYLQLEREPFFFSPGTDTAGLAAAVRGLAAEQAEVLALIGSSPALYPVDFLGAYARASSAFDLFSKAPSETAALKVLEEIGCGVEAYGAAAATASQAVAKQFNAAGVNITSGFGGRNITSSSTVAADFALIQRNAAAASGRLAGLRNCLLKSSPSCLASPPLERLAPAPRSAVVEPVILEPARLGLKPGDVRGPYLVESGCWGGRRENYLYYGERCLSGLCIQWGQLATDAFFRKLREAVPSQKRLIDRGYRIAPQNATAPYGCGDLEYMPVLAALDDFTVRYASSPVFHGQALLKAAALPGLAAALQGVQAAELAFFSARIRSQAGLEKLGGAYLRALDALQGGESELLKAALLERSRVINLKTAGFGLILNRITFHLANYRKAFVRAKLDLKMRRDTFYISRDHYSLVFMPFSPSVWLLGEKPAYLLPGESPRKDPLFLNYREALDLYGPLEVKRTMKLSTEGQWETLAF